MTNCKDFKNDEQTTDKSVSTCECSNFRNHKWIIYFLIALSLCLHSSTLFDKFHSENNFDRQPVIKEDRQNVDVVDVVKDAGRSKRSVKGSSRDYSDAKVEFIHPKLREEMDANEQQDPNNPWVWLTSYSRIPVSLIFKHN